MQSHPTISLEERSRLCRCLNYEKLSLEAYKDLAKNPRVPPRLAVQALASQKHTNYDNDKAIEFYDKSSHKSNNSNNNNNDKHIFTYEQTTRTQHHHQYQDHED